MARRYKVVRQGLKNGDYRSIAAGGKWIKTYRIGETVEDDHGLFVFRSCGDAMKWMGVSDACLAVEAEGLLASPWYITDPAKKMDWHHCLPWEGKDFACPRGTMLYRAVTPVAAYRMDLVGNKRVLRLIERKEGVRRG